MSKLRAALLAALMGAATIGAAAKGGHDPRVTTRVEPVPAQVTLSRAAGPGGVALDTFAAYEVTLDNDNPNALNRVFFNARARNVGSSEAVVFDSTVPSDLSCTGIGTASIACSLDSLAPRAAASFFVVVRAPKSGTRIDVDWIGGGDEGKGKGKGCCDQTGTASTPLIDPVSDGSYLTQLTSFVKPAGGTFFTGDEAVAKAGDGWTTLVKVPPFNAQAPTTASVVESALAGSCAPYALANGCFETDLTIPGKFASLDITIRWDKSLFRLGYHTRPGDVKLFYIGANPQVAYPVQLTLCANDALTYGTAPSPGRPCFKVPPRLLNPYDTANPSLWGDLEFRVLALDNGRYIN